LFDDLHLDIKKPVDKIGKYFTIEQETNKDVKEKMMNAEKLIMSYSSLSEDHPKFDESHPNFESEKKELLFV
jgi:hypothetical protein